MRLYIVFQKTCTCLVDDKISINISYDDEQF